MTKAKTKPADPGVIGGPMMDIARFLAGAIQHGLAPRQETVIRICDGSVNVHIGPEKLALPDPEG